MTRRSRTIAEVRRAAERGDGTMWTDARWYEVLTRHEIQTIISEYGYGPLKDSRTGKEWAVGKRAARVS